MAMQRYMPRLQGDTLEELLRWVKEVETTVTFDDETHTIAVSRNALSQKESAVFYRELVKGRELAKRHGLSVPEMTKLALDQAGSHMRQ